MADVLQSSATESKASRHRVHLEAQPYFDEHHILEVSCHKLELRVRKLRHFWLKRGSDPSGYAHQASLPGPVR
eukprot:5411456-Amphidinium_carterae.1